MWLDRKSPTAWVNSERVLFGSEHATALIASRPGRAVQRGSPVNLWVFAAVPKVRDSRFQATPTLMRGNKGSEESLYYSVRTWSGRGSLRIEQPLLM